MNTGIRIKSEKIIKAEECLDNNIYNSTSWTILLKELANVSINECRSSFETAVSTFPLYYKFWAIYIDKEIKERNFENAEILFKRCLSNIPNVELWRSYLNYIKEHKSSLSNYRDKMTQAFELAIETVGYDIQSHLIWQDYISFHKSEEAHGSFAEGQKIMNVRKVFQRAIQIPIQNLDNFWKDYSAFEQSVNKTLSEKLLTEKIRDLNNSKRVAKDCENNMRGIIRTNIPTLPILNNLELKQKQLWRNFIEWEKSNPLHIEDESIMTKRVIYAYEQFIMCFCFHPDVWYDACNYLFTLSTTYKQKGDIENSQILMNECLNVYEKATQGMMNKNLFLHLAYADVLEKCNKYEKSITIFESLLNNPVFDANIIFINYMRIVRRNQGIEKQRSIFKRARQNPSCSYHVYLAAANIELRTNQQETVATKIFDLGLSRFHTDDRFIRSFLNHLKFIKDNLVVRSFYEKLLAIAPDKFKCDIFEEYYDFEVNCNNPINLLDIENRVYEFYKNQKIKDTSTNNSYYSRGSFAINRFRCYELVPCNLKELKSMGVDIKFNNETYHDHIVDTKLVNSETTLAETNEKLLCKMLLSSINKLSLPDVAQMRPFKPVPRSYAMSNQFIAGGLFPPPSLLMDLITKIPQSTNYNGPYVHTDELMNKIIEISLSIGDLKNNDPNKNNFLSDNSSTLKGNNPIKKENDSNFVNQNILNDSTDVFKLRQQIRSSMIN